MADNQEQGKFTPVHILGDGGHAKVVRDSLAYPSPRAGYEVGVAIGVGDIAARRRLFDEHGGVTVIHWSAVVSPSASIGRGAQIMAGAVVQPHAVIGDNTLVNTNASVDHDCVIGAHCHIAPGATLCGSVVLGDGCFIGAGSIIVQGVRLRAGTFIPAGSLVVKQDDIRRPRRLVSGDGKTQG